MSFYFKFADFCLNFSYKQNIIKCLENIYSFMKSFQIVEIMEVYFFGEGRGVDFLFASILMLKISFKMSHHCMLNINPRNLENGASHKKP